MITTAKALIDVKEAVRNILTQAGFADGTKGITNDKPMFWFVNVSSKEASEKETYLSYNITSLSPSAFGDGNPAIRQATIEIVLVSRNKNVDTYLTNLNNAFVLRGWTFELNRPPDFDYANQFYIYSFLTHCEAG